MDIENLLKGRKKIIKIFANGRFLPTGRRVPLVGKLKI
jgi:hypothetical protein